jgi:hypothetical protein
MFGVHQYVSSWFANELLCVSYMMLVSCVLTCQCNGVSLSSPHPIMSLPHPIMFFFLYIPICYRFLRSFNLYILLYILCTLCNSHYLSRFFFQICEVCGLSIFQKRIKPSLATCQKPKQDFKKKPCYMLTTSLKLWSKYVKFNCFSLQNVVMTLCQYFQKNF